MRLRRALLTGTLSTLAVAGPATAQRAGPASTLPAFAMLTGAWEGEGTLMGRAGAFTMAWSPSADGDMILDFTNGFVGDAGAVTPVLQAKAIYTVEPGGRVTAHWTDSRPQEIHIVAEVGDSAVVSEWTAPSETGRTEYRIGGDGAVTVRDWVRVDGALRQFGEATYRRRPAGG